jgi:hypothetical protein
LQEDQPVDKGDGERKLSLMELDIQMLFRGNGAPFPFTQNKSVMAVKLSVGSFRA